jgi:hypothetical protein
VDEGTVTLHELTALMESLDEKQIIAIISRPEGSSVVGGKKDVASRVALECAAGLRELLVPETFEEQFVHLGNLYAGQAHRNMPAVTDAIIQLASTYETFKQLSDIPPSIKETVAGKFADKQMNDSHEQALALVETIIFEMDFNSVSTLPASRLQKLRELAVALDSLGFEFNVDQPTMNGVEMKVDNPLDAAIKKAEVLLAARPARQAPRPEANAHGLRDPAPAQAAVQPSTTPARTVEQALTALGNGFVVANVVTALKALNAAAGGKPLAREQIAQMLLRMDPAVLASLARVLGGSECQYLAFAMKGVARHDNVTDSAASNEMLARSTDLREIRVAAFELLGMKSLKHPRFDLVDAIEKPGVAAVLLQAHGVTARASNNMVIAALVKSASASK